MRSTAALAVNDPGGVKISVTSVPENGAWVTRAKNAKSKG